MADRHDLRAVVIDDDRDMRASLGELLTASGWCFRSLSRAEDLAEAEAAFDPQVVLSDVRMPGMAGTDLLNGRGEDAPPIVLISAHGDIPMAVDAMQRGAYSFLEKPFDPRRLINILTHAADQFRLRRDTARLRSRLADLSGLDRLLIGESETTVRLREDILDLAEARANVLILGETGTGKGLVARALHDLSSRSGAAFIVVNCAAIAADRVEATLFGVADGPRGMIAAADGGTLFLDEIGACPLETQAKLLRAIEAREVQPIGAERATAVDFRMLAATNEDLDDAVARGRFREDLLYRLNTFVISIPPLKGRSDDILPLFEHFLGEASRTMEAVPPPVSPEDLMALLAHDWPGNVRELRHVAERRVLAARRGRGSVSEAIRRDDITDVPDTLREAVAAFERQLIGKAITAHQGRMDAVAEALGIGRRTLNEKIVKLGLKKDDYL
ncbi:MAG: sigma-54 dependent transcriptional regulator [Pseudomonadota bacterium]